jgi:hypothetical protein
MGQVVFQALCKRRRLETDGTLGPLVRHTDGREVDEAVHLCVGELSGVVPLQVGFQSLGGLVEQVAVLIASV